MSPRRHGHGHTLGRFPRVSGDEPPFRVARVPLELFSPRERG